MRVPAWIKRIEIACALMVAFLMSTDLSAQTSEAQEAEDIWASSNLIAWEVPTFDLVKRSSEERAKMLEDLGFRNYAYLSTGDPLGKPDINTSQLDIDEEIAAMRRHGIAFRAWYFWINVDDPADDPNVGRTLEAFKRHDIHPDIWLPQSFADPHAESKEGFPSNPQEQSRRVTREAARVAALAKLVAPYGCRVSIYNHRGWFGMMDNQLAILDRLKELGITNVGMVYNFSHAQSPIHDDSQSFAELWARIKRHVTTVNVYITQPRHLEMVRIIQESGWNGSVGLLPFGGNSEIGFRNALWMTKWSTSQAASVGKAPKN